MKRTKSSEQKRTEKEEGEIDEIRYAVPINKRPRMSSPSQPPPSPRPPSSPPSRSSSRPTSRQESGHSPVPAADSDYFVFDAMEEDVIIEEPIPQRGDASMEDGELVGEGSASALEWTRNLSLSMGLLTDIEHTEQKTSQKPPKPKRTCWNCDGDHSLHQCPEPRNTRRIMENKQAFQDKFQNRMDAGRYHDKTEDSKKYRPGSLSPALREALGIGPDDIPDWIYKMRKMGFIQGYPPAYLKAAVKREAKVLNFHFDDQRQNGNAEKDRESPPPVLDPKLMYRYSGFNFHYPRLRDRFNENYRVPPFEEYCRFVQEKLTADHEERVRERDLLVKTKEEIVLNDVPDDDEIVLLEPPPAPPTIPQVITIEDEDIAEPASPDPSPSEKIVDVTTPKSAPTLIPLEKEEGPSKIIPKGLPCATTIGTPVMTRLNRDGSEVKTDTPQVDKFRDGIQPFLYLDEEESNPRKGFFSKLMNNIKKLRK